MMATDRPVMNKDARSPYGRYGKTPHHYQPWVLNRKHPPLTIQRELAAAGGWTDKRGKARTFIDGTVS